MELNNILKSFTKEQFCYSDLEALRESLMYENDLNSSKSKELMKSEIVGALMLPIISKYDTFHLASAMHEIALFLMDSELFSINESMGDKDGYTIMDIIKRMERAFLGADILTGKDKKDIQGKFLLYHQMNI